MEDLHLQELLEHSLALDERARELTRSAQKKRQGGGRSRSRSSSRRSRASSGTSAARSRGHSRRQSVDVDVGGVHMHLSRQGSVDMRVDGENVLL